MRAFAISVFTPTTTTTVVAACRLHGFNVGIACCAFLPSSLGIACTAHSQQENQFISVPDEIVDQCSPKLRAMMGYKPFGGLGMNNGFSSRSSSRRQQVPGKTFVQAVLRCV